LQLEWKTISAGKESKVAGRIQKKRLRGKVYQQDRSSISDGKIGIAAGKGYYCLNGTLYQQESKA
jgi:hypothetical protein